MEAMDTSAADRLRSFVERIERLESEKGSLYDNMAEVYNEAKSTGFDVKILRKVISLRRKSPHVIAEEEQLLALYRVALESSPTA